MGAYGLAWELTGKVRWAALAAPVYLFRPANQRTLNLCGTSAATSPASRCHRRHQHRGTAAVFGSDDPSVLTGVPGFRLTDRHPPDLGLGVFRLYRIEESAATP